MGTLLHYCFIRRQMIFRTTIKQLIKDEHVEDKDSVSGTCT